MDIVVKLVARGAVNPASAFPGLSLRMISLPSPDQIRDASRALGVSVAPSELHGALCGWLAGGGADEAQWLGRVLADDALAAPEPGDALDLLRRVSVTQLGDRDFGLELLLPPPEAGLGERTEALFDWCRGFLGGFGLAAGAAPPLSEEGEEALHDLARLAQAAPDTDEEDEDDESALAEIEEFVRVAALLLHGDCVLGPSRRRSLH